MPQDFTIFERASLADQHIDLRGNLLSCCGIGIQVMLKLWWLPCNSISVPIQIFLHCQIAIACGKWGAGAVSSSA